MDRFFSGPLADQMELDKLRDQFFQEPVPRTSRHEREGSRQWADGVWCWAVAGREAVGRWGRSAGTRGNIQQRLGNKLRFIARMRGRERDANSPTPVSSAGSAEARGRLASTDCDLVELGSSHRLPWPQMRSARVASVGCRPPQTPLAAPRRPRPSPARGLGAGGSFSRERIMHCAPGSVGRVS